MSRSILLICLFISHISYGQTYNLIQNFESGGSGSDGCWVGYNASSTPTTNTFFTSSSIVYAGSFSGGMYSCCGGSASNTPTYYISPILKNGIHSVDVYLRQSSFFTENLEIGTVSDAAGSNFIVAFTKSAWPSTPAWELTTTSVTTNSTNNRIAFRIPPNSLKTYYLDNIVLGDVDNLGAATCNYSLVTGIENLNAPRISVSVSPNPFSELIIIQSKEPCRFYLYDLTGRKIIEKNIKTSDIISTSELTTGVYFYRVITKGFKTYDGKLVK